MAYTRKRYRHGDVVLVGVFRVLTGAAEETVKALAYGETTGHAHRLTEGKYKFWQKDGKRFVQVFEAATLVHEEHAPLIIAKGVYEQRAEREFDYTRARDRIVAD
jgi:hypothetical protein